MRDDIPTNGDQYITGHDRELWTLTHHCLFKFGVLVVFTKREMHIPEGIAEDIQFLVTEGLPNSVACYDYLKKETQPFIKARVPGKLFKHGFPGTNVAVSLFRGLDGHIDESVKVGERESLKQDTLNIIKDLEVKKRRASLTLISSKTEDS